MHGALHEVRVAARKRNGAESQSENEHHGLGALQTKHDRMANEVADDQHRRDGQADCGQNGSQENVDRPLQMIGDGGPHGANGLSKQTALSEKGEVINGRGDTPNRHDVLTGSQADGTAFAAGEDRTCKNWTSSTQGAAMVGHFDRKGLRDDEPSKSWNTSHPSRGSDGGCSQADLKSTGGDGLLYCFAAN